MLVHPAVDRAMGGGHVRVRALVDRHRCLAPGELARLDPLAPGDLRVDAVTTIIETTRKSLPFALSHSKLTGWACEPYDLKYRTTNRLHDFALLSFG